MAQSEVTRSEFLIGAAALAVVVALVVYAIMSPAPLLRENRYELQANFDSVDGLSVGADVRLAGVPVGTVTDITLDPQTFRVAATFAIRDGLALPDDSTIAVVPEGLLGGMFLEVSPGSSAFMLAPGDVVVDAQSSGSLMSALMRLVASEGLR